MFITVCALPHHTKLLSGVAVSRDSNESHGSSGPLRFNIMLRDAIIPFARSEVLKLHTSRSNSTIIPWAATRKRKAKKTPESVRLAHAVAFFSASLRTCTNLDR